MTDEQMIKAYRVLLEESWKRVKVRVHPLDLPKREEKYKNLLFIISFPLPFLQILFSHLLLI